MSKLSLSDLLAFYPSIDEDEFQKKISAKQEFAELESDPKERLPNKRGSYFKHQKWIRRFLRVYDRLMLFHETGTGKSCAITATAELLKDLHQQALDPKILENPDTTLDGYIRKAVIITSNDKLKDRIFEELVCKCTEMGTYDTIEAGMSKQKIRNNLKKWYRIETRKAFAIEMSKMSPAILKREFSNTIFFIDEAQKLRFTESKKKDKRSFEDLGAQALYKSLSMLKASEIRRIAEFNSDPDLQIDITANIPTLIQSIINHDLITNEDLQQGIENGEFQLSKKKKQKSDVVFGSENVYVQFWRLAHLVPDIKMVLATATPSLDNVQEIIPLMNLLHPSKTPLNIDDPSSLNLKTYKDIRPYLDISPSTNLLKLSSEELVDIFQGYISYIQRLDIGVNIIYEGVPISSLQNAISEEDASDYEIQTKIVLDEMHPFQAEVYREVNTTENNYLRYNEREVSNFVYPDGSFGTKGLKKYINAQKDRYQIKQSTASEREFYKILRKPLSDPKGIQKLSTKFVKIIRTILDNPKDNIFVYSNYTEAGGTVPFSLALEAQGYERYLETASSFEAYSEESSNTYCSGDISKKRIRSKIKKKKRYALLTAETGSNAASSMFELFNSYENRHGEYIQVFITSQVGGIGISLNNVLHIIMLDSEWNPAGNYQAESRAIRATGFQDLLEEQKEVNVRIYNHVAYTCKKPISKSLKKKEKTSVLCNPDNPMLSVDLRIYTIAEQKDRNIKQNERFLKRIAVDCQSHYERNKPPKDAEDYTKVCDYDVCERPCYDPEPLKKDFTTFDIYYIQEPVKYLLDILSFELHHNTDMISSNTLIQKAISKGNPNYEYLNNDQYISYVGLKLLESPQYIINRFGMPSVIQKDGNMFYSANIPITGISLKASSLCQSLYNNELIGHELISLKEIIRQKTKDKALSIIHKIEEIVPYSDAYEEFIHTTSGTILSVILETILLIPKDERSSRQESFVQRMSLLNPKASKSRILPHPSLWFSIKEPKNMLNKIQLRLDVKMGKIPNIKKAGRPPKDGVYAPDEIEYDPSGKVDFKIGKGEEPYDWGGGTQNVIFHVMFSVIPGESNYADIPTFNNMSGPIRLYKPNEGVWRYATPVEKVAYSLWAQKELYEFKQYYENFPVYGFLFQSSEPNFILRARYKDALDASTNKRNQHRGRTCTTYSVKDLIEMLAMSEISIKDIANEVEWKKITSLNEKNLDEKIKQYKQKTSLSKSQKQKTLYMFQRVQKERRQKDYLCNLFQTQFRNNNMMFQTY